MYASDVFGALPVAKASFSTSITLAFHHSPVITYIFAVRERKSKSNLLKVEPHIHQNPTSKENLIHTYTEYQILNSILGHLLLFFYKRIIVRKIMFYKVLTINSIYNKETRKLVNYRGESGLPCTALEMDMTDQLWVG